MARGPPPAVNGGGYGGGGGYGDGGYRGGRGYHQQAQHYGGGRSYGRAGDAGSQGFGAAAEADPFAEADHKKKEVDALFQADLSGIDFDAYDDIPVEATGDNVPQPITAFTDVDLGPSLAANVQRCKYSKPTPVQRYSIPICLQGRDLMACAQTGSGKTAAFCFPIIANISRSEFQPSGRQRKAFPLALVLSPTRELSCQIFDEARKFTYQTGIRPVVVYGGAPVVNQVGSFFRVW